MPPGEWKPVPFDCAEYRDTGTHILRGLDEIQSLFDDHIVKTQAMRGSPFIKPFERRVREWEEKLVSMQETLDEWLKCQSVWLYLEPIFASEDIMRQMPTEAKRFTQVDRLWRKVMVTTVAKPNVLLATAQEGLLVSFQEANRLLELIQKGLNDYLEKKRLAFARLFFLSNDELLQILSETKDPLRVQPHLKKCFEGIAQLTFTPQLIIVGMESVEGEKVKFSTSLNPAEANGMVEKWLLQVEGAMKESLKDVLGTCHADYTKTNRVEWALKWPGKPTPSNPACNPQHQRLQLPASEAAAVSLSGCNPTPRLAGMMVLPVDPNPNPTPTLTLTLNPDPDPKP